MIAGTPPIPSPKRSYAVLTEADWTDAAEKSARGATQADLAAEYGVSERTVATHLPKALERRRKALAASTGGTASTSHVPAMVLAGLPDVADRESATRHWRQSAWCDTQALQSQLRALTANTAPDAKAIRAISAAAAALKDLIKIGADILDVDRLAVDEEIPELVIRELTAAEVAAIRQGQVDRQANGGAELDPEELEALRGETTDPDAGVVIEELGLAD